MKKNEKLYEGKAKIVYSTDDPELVIQFFKDDATAFDGIKKGQIGGKGVANNLISCHLFSLLENNGIATHFIKKLSDNEMLVRRVKIIPVELVVRNVAAGSLCKRYGVPEGQVFSEPIVECYYKNDAFHDPAMNDDHIIRFNLANAGELSAIKATALRINQILKEYFDSIGIILVDFKLEFGRYNDQILLADEISPDTCRFWEKGTNRKLDKDRFRFDLGEVEEAYTEMLKRITGIQK
ncbi:MAG TPA: phosphoribosylaminoimidazolesuccinocarboxamide synthase [Candidatus Marinimicrobia bacterium]|jgi:phosphoribosylaminoimidazole-succinocarboxamide synthase|nr:phosphoribosylaminoimidazolesuccinocarboxamide synthase [Candidatus Neomarinimicrobiota bacterium]HOU17534.1 phosphoribosylaminoimidazolesuccinocarboxamide synthase [Candidatus Neomarinimicrobiota bacterium]HQK11028.1 phosphoribosylaminoimidazolesuccinocarboxamide synthase [Candidatus Neomarinimicrobiota bacterium]